MNTNLYCKCTFWSEKISAAASVESWQQPPVKETILAIWPLLPSPAFLVSHAGRLFSLQPFLRSANCPSQRFNRSQNLVIMTIIVRDQSNDIVPWLRAWFGVGFRGHYVPCAVSPLPSCNSTRMTNRISSVTSIWDSKKECIIQPQLNLKKNSSRFVIVFSPSVVVVDKMRERAGFKFFGKRRMWDVAAG